MKRTRKRKNGWHSIVICGRRINFRIPRSFIAAIREQESLAKELTRPLPKWSLRLFKNETRPPQARQAAEPTRSNGGN